MLIASRGQEVAAGGCRWLEEEQAPGFTEGVVTFVAAGSEKHHRVLVNCFRLGHSLLNGKMIIHRLTMTERLVQLHELHLVELQFQLCVMGI